MAGVDLAGYARTAAALAEGAEPRRAVLSRAGLDEARWMEVEKTWLLRVATASMQGDLALLAELDEAAAAAQAEIAAAAPKVPLEVYARIDAALTDGASPARVLAGAKLTPAAFARARRAWTAEIASNEAVATQYRALLEQERRGGA